MSCHLYRLLLLLPAMITSESMYCDVVLCGRISRCALTSPFPPSPSLSLSHCRIHGVRIMIAEKNIGRRVYSINQLQAQFLPAVYRPPKEVLEDLMRKDDT